MTAFGMSGTGISLALTTGRACPAPETAHGCFAALQWPQRGTVRAPFQLLCAYSLLPAKLSSDSSGYADSNYSTPSSALGRKFKIECPYSFLLRLWPSSQALSSVLRWSLPVPCGWGDPLLTHLWGGHSSLEGKRHSQGQSFSWPLLGTFLMIIKFIICVPKMPVALHWL